MWRYYIPTYKLDEIEEYLESEDNNSGISYRGFVDAMLELFDNDIIEFED